jgi:membrane protein YdbS with pleckstrin-like domain
MLSIYRLPNQEPGEKIIRILRRDIFILFKKVIFAFILFVLPFVFLALMIAIYPELMSGEISSVLILLAVSAYYLFAWLFFFFMFIDYYLDVSIITNERIIDIDQNGFFSRTIAEQRLERVQDVTSEVKGVMPTVFRYGDVFVQTASETQRFDFREIPEPDAVRDMIIKLVEESKCRHASPQTNADITQANAD